MNNIIKEIANHIEKLDVKIIDTSTGFDNELTKEDQLDLPAKKYVLPYILFSGTRSTFLKIGESCVQFNKESKDNNKFIYWKVIVFDWNKDNAEYCLSATTNRMDLHDPSVVTGLTREKRTELLNVSSLLFSDFLDYLIRQKKE